VRAERTETSTDLSHTDVDAVRFWGRLLDAALAMVLVATALGLPYMFSDDVSVSRVGLGGFLALIVGHALGTRWVLRRAVQKEMRRRRQAFFVAGMVIAPLYLFGVHHDGGLRSPMILAFLPAAALAAAAFPWRDARWLLLPMAVGYLLLVVTTDDVEVWRAVWGLGVALSIVIPVMMIRRGTLLYTTDQERSTSTLRRELSIDSLTGCLNHRAFHQRLATAQCGVRTRDTCCVVVLDVDHFKSINDNHGHLRGDAVLRELGHVLRSTLRANDVTGRIGGEEFALFLPDTRLVEGIALTERVRAAIAAAQPGGLVVTISAGVAEHVADRTLTATLNHADVLLYQAKVAGRDRVVA
jgi:diguanylate cyclase (GGDEF)-like protein